jgi:G2/mitotic-specific cyclin 1/2
MNLKSHDCNVPTDDSKIKNEQNIVLEAENYEYSDTDSKSELYTDCDIDSYSEVDFEITFSSTDQRNFDKPQYLPFYASEIFIISSQKSLYCSTTLISQTQSEITPQSREIAIRWIFQIHEGYHMFSETLYQSVYLFNSFLSKVNIPKSKLQLFAIVSLLIASKIEETNILHIEDFVELTSFPKHEIIDAEKYFLKSLNFNFSFETSKLFLRRFLNIIQTDLEITEISNFFCELTLFKIEFVDFSSSTIACACACLAKLSIGNDNPYFLLNDEIEFLDRKQVIDCIQILNEYAVNIVKNEKCFLYQRYTKPLLIGAIKKIDLSPNRLKQFF